MSAKADERAELERAMAEFSGEIEVLPDQVASSGKGDTRYHFGAASVSPAEAAVVVARSKRRHDNKGTGRVLSVKQLPDDRKAYAIRQKSQKLQRIAREIEIRKAKRQEALTTL